MTSIAHQDIAANRADGRIDARHKVFEPALMSARNGEMRVHLINISSSGALVHAADLPARGELVQLQIGGAWHAGRVAWAGGQRFGLAFSRPLQAEALNRLLEA